MDGFAATRPPPTEVIPDAVTVMDPFYAEVWIMPMLGGLRLVTAVTLPVMSA